MNDLRNALGVLLTLPGAEKMLNGVAEQTLPYEEYQQLLLNVLLFFYVFPNPTFLYQPGVRDPSAFPLVEALGNAAYFLKSYLRTDSQVLEGPSGVHEVQTWAAGMVGDRTLTLLFFGPGHIVHAQARELIARAHDETTGSKVGESLLPHHLAFSHVLLPEVLAGAHVYFKTCDLRNPSKPLVQEVVLRLLMGVAEERLNRTVRDATIDLQARLQYLGTPRIFHFARPHLGQGRDLIPPRRMEELIAASTPRGSLGRSGERALDSTALEGVIKALDDEYIQARLSTLRVASPRRPADEARLVPNPNTLDYIAALVAHGRLREFIS